nr:DMT family transporter [Trichothermofontia sichuanensis]
MIIMSGSPPVWKLSSLLITGVLAIATASIFIRIAFRAVPQAGVGFSLVLAASRLTIAALCLLPAWRQVRLAQPYFQALPYALGAGTCLAVHFGTWITSLAYTSIAASTVIVTTNPVWVALLSWWLWREQPSRRTLLGIGIALSGGILITLGDAHGGAGSHPLFGDALALVGAWMASLYFLLGREAQRRGLSIGSYAAIAYTTAALLLLPLPLLANTAYWPQPPIVYICIILMAILSQVIGHTSCNWAVRWISPTVVALALLLEPVGASLLAWMIFQEVPGPLVFIGAMILLLGIAIAILGQHSE